MGGGEYKIEVVRALRPKIDSSLFRKFYMDRKNRVEIKWRTISQ